MKDKSKVIFGNEISRKGYRKAVKGKKKYQKKYGDDSAADYSVKLVKNACLHPTLGVEDIRVAEGRARSPLTVKRASSSATSAWASVTTAFPSQWPPAPTRWATSPTGWI